MNIECVESHYAQNSRLFHGIVSYCCRSDASSLRTDGPSELFTPPHHVEVDWYTLSRGLNHLHLYYTMKRSKHTLHVVLMNQNNPVVIRLKTWNATWARRLPCLSGCRQPLSRTNSCDWTDTSTIYSLCHNTSTERYISLITITQYCKHSTDSTDERSRSTRANNWRRAEGDRARRAGLCRRPSQGMRLARSRVLIFLVGPVGREGTRA